jgi:hypothetical protein
MTKETDGFYCKGKKVADLPQIDFSSHETPKTKLEVTNEFNLSNKIYDRDVVIIFSDEKRVINVFHVKEFIKRLKEEIQGLNYFSERNFKIVLPEIIDKLAGEKLK